MATNPNEVREELNEKSADDLSGREAKLTDDKELYEKIARIRAGLYTEETDREESDSAVMSHLQGFNWGLTNMLGMPSDIGTAISNQLMQTSTLAAYNRERGIEPIRIESPAIGGEQIRELTWLQKQL